MRKTGLWFACAVLLSSADANACAPAPHRGEFVGIAEESALIVWEPATKTQHFIRRATFDGEARDFGFLVPTPTVPALAPADDGVFDHLARKTEPPIVHRTQKSIDWTPLVAFPFVAYNKGEGVVTAAAPVEVLSTQKVAGYEAAILDATDATALSDWLAKNGYDTTPDLAEWLKHYVDQRWIISAFKIDKTADAVARTSAVRMTFTTERPFFPYREPASQQAFTGPRVLKVWFVGPERVAGTVGDQKWTGQMFWTDAVRDLELGGVKLASNARLTAFEDYASPRPGVADLFFDRDSDQKVVVPPPTVITETDTTWVPADALIAPILIGAFLIRRSRKRRREIGH